jgi:hypothetical protein
MDTAKRYFTRLRVEEIKECKTVIFRVCTQTQPVQLTHLDEECTPEWAGEATQKIWTAELCQSRPGGPADGHHL